MENIQAYKKGFETVMKAMEANTAMTIAQANALMEPFKKEVHELQTFSEECAEKAQKTINEEEHAVETRATTMVLFSVAIIIVGILMMVVSMRQLIHSITAPLQAAVKVIASGNLKDRLIILAQDEIGDLMRAFNLLSERLLVKTEEFKNHCG